MTLPRSELSEAREALRILVNVSILERVNQELLINCVKNIIIPLGKPLQIPVTFLFD